MEEDMDLSPSSWGARPKAEPRRRTTRRRPSRLASLAPQG